MQRFADNILSIKAENIKFKQQLDQANEMLKCAIVPKFKVGQECYLIDNNFDYSSHTETFTLASSNVIKQYNCYIIKDYGFYSEEDLFATKQEAQAKLQELQGGE